MNELKRSAVISELVEKLREQGSWCGETHVQKTTYFLQELLNVPTGFKFILYKHGPFSFDFRDELSEMRADGLIEIESRGYLYGPSLNATGESKELRTHFPKTLAKYQNQLDFVSQELGPKGVSELEQLSTALFVHLEDPSRARERQIDRVLQLKPHLSRTVAAMAWDSLKELIRKSRDLGVSA